MSAGVAARAHVEKKYSFAGFGKKKKKKKKRKGWKGVKFPSLNKGGESTRKKEREIAPGD